MLYQRLLLIIYFLFILSCSKEVEPKFDSILESLNIEADFNLINGFLVRVERAIPITTKSIIYNDLIVDDAKVLLKDITLNALWLIPFDTATEAYYLPLINPLEKHRYQIEIQWKGKKYQSLEIATPNKPIVHLKNKSIKQTNLFGNDGYQLEYFIDLDSIKTNQFYSATAFLKSQNYGRSLGFTDFTQRDELCGYKSNILPSTCLGNSQDNLKISEFILDNITLPKTGIRPYKGRHYVIVSTIVPNYYNYLLSSGEPDPLERFFLNPSLIPSDFPDAFGTFLISNQIIIDSLDIK